MNKYLTYIACFFLGVIFAFISSFLFNNSSNEDNIVKTDTNTVIRYETKVKHDTVVKWYENVVYKQSKPEIVYQQKVDTQFLETSKDLDVMLNVEKDGKDLKIYALNQNGKLLKEYIYHNIGNDFIATSTNNNIFIKSQLWYWNGINPLIKYTIPVHTDMKLNSGDINVGISTGINYNNTLYLSPAILYDVTNKDVKLDFELNYNIK